MFLFGASYIAAIVILQVTDIGNKYQKIFKSYFFYLAYVPIFNLIAIVIIGRTVVSSIIYPY